jgi:hypothetical protein
VEAKPWQAVYAMALLERSKFGLNELLGTNAMSTKISHRANPTRKPYLAKKLAA